MLTGVMCLSHTVFRSFYGLFRYLQCLTCCTFLGAGDRQQFLSMQNNVDLES